MATMRRKRTSPARNMDLMTTKLPIANDSSVEARVSATKTPPRGLADLEKCERRGESGECKREPGAGADIGENCYEHRLAIAAPKVNPSRFIDRVIRNAVSITCRTVSTLYAPARTERELSSAPSACAGKNAATSCRPCLNHRTRYNPLVTLKNIDPSVSAHSQAPLQI